MTLSIDLLTLLHILAFVYWVGGDLGAFVSSYTLIDPSKPTQVRMFALKVVNNVDMAPKTSLIIALPSGINLAAAKGWLDIPEIALAAIWALALVWLVLVWRIHLKHLPGAAVERRIDMSIRWVLVSALITVGIAGIAKVGPEIPLFIAIKCLLLASAMLAGLIVRRALGPLFEAVREMAANGPTPEGDAVMRKIIMRRSKPTVVTIWLLVTTAAFIGISTPL